MPINARTVNAHYIPNGKAKTLTWYTDGAQRPAPSTASWVVTSKVKGQGHKDTWPVWQLLAYKSRTKSPRNTKTGRNVAQPICMYNKTHSFKAKRWKVKVTRPINAEIKSVSYLPNWNTYELQILVVGTQTEHEDPYHRQAPSPRPPICKGRKVTVRLTGVGP